MCWGRGMLGELGNGHSSVAKSPVAVSGIDDGRSVAAGNMHACVTRAGGTVACWGHNGNRQLGDDTDTASAVPDAVVSLTGASAVSSSP